MGRYDLNSNILIHLKKKRKKLCLYEKETRTNHKIFFASNEQKEVCLGAKMHNKAASTTMDTLKEILNDISTSCKDMSVGQTIM